MVKQQNSKEEIKFLRTCEKVLNNPKEDFREKGLMVLRMIKLRLFTLQ